MLQAFRFKRTTRICVVFGTVWSKRTAGEECEYYRKTSFHFRNNSKGTYCTRADQLEFQIENKVFIDLFMERMYSTIHELNGVVFKGCVPNERCTRVHLRAELSKLTYSVFIQHKLPHHALLP